MYTKGKYVIGDVRNEHFMAVTSAVLVSEAVNHSSLRRLFEPDSIKSAGFFHVSTDEEGKPVVHAYGESTGLRIKSDPESDRKWISKVLGLDC